MATIPKLKRNRQSKVLSKTDKYKMRRKVYQSKDWKKGMRLLQLQKEPLCRVCSLLGVTKAAECVHHIKSVTDASTPEQLYDIAFDDTNLVSLCTHHHSLLHTLEEFKDKEYKKAEELADYLQLNPQVDSQN